MEHFRIVMTLIGMLFLSIIGVYVWTFKVYRDTKNSLGKVYEVMNKEFVREKVFTALHQNLKEDVTEIKTDVKCLLTKM